MRKPVQSGKDILERLEGREVSGAVNQQGQIAVLSTVAPAKLNFGLHVLRQRTDGFHDLSTILCPIAWSDVVHVRFGEKISLTCTDPSLPVDERNLITRAATALARTFGIKAGATLQVEKVLPAGAGLGGGSSDAAATLRLLCDFWKIEYEAAIAGRDSARNWLRRTVFPESSRFTCRGAR